MFTISKDTAITEKVVGDFITLHKAGLTRLDKLFKYYKGEQDICSRIKGKDLANNRLVCNHAKYITDTVLGYFVGNPVSYSFESEQLDEWLRLADVQTEDIDLAIKASIFGNAYELIYMSNTEQATPLVASLDPRNAFVVYDDTVQHSPVFGVYYYNTADKKTKGVLYTDLLEQDFSIGGGAVVFSTEPRVNIFGQVNLVEIYNNDIQQGDFEQVISLIDAYNILQSDRVNDKEQFVNAILLIKGQMLGLDADEESQTFKALKKYGLLSLDADSDAKWLTRQFDESSVEVLRKSIEQDIHKFSNVPSMSDEQFAGNTSGVAMAYKLLGFEQLVKIKERYFKEGLRYRLSLFCTALKLKHGEQISPLDITIKFTRALPVDELAKAQLVQSLEGLLPIELLLSLLPFIDDPKAVAEQLKIEKAEQTAEQKAMFANTKLVNNDEE